MGRAREKNTRQCTTEKRGTIIRIDCTRELDVSRLRLNAQLFNEKRRYARPIREKQITVVGGRLNTKIIVQTATAYTRTLKTTTFRQRSYLESKK